MRRVTHHIVLFFFTLSSVFAHAVPIDWAPEKRLPIRSNAQACHTLLVPNEAEKNDSVGVLISSNEIDDFETQLDSILANEGPQSILGGHFFVSGIAIGKEKETQDAFDRALAKRDLLKDGTRVTVLSVPKTPFNGISKQSALALAERLKYFEPSLEKYYQTPLPAEVALALVTTAFIEFPNITYLYKNLPLMDANITTTVHVIVLIGYSILTRYLTNWTTRPGQSTPEQLATTAALSVPFVANYSIATHATDISNFYHEQGWEKLIAAAPEAAGLSLLLQTLTLTLQVALYRVVIANGVGNWQTSQKGTENSWHARVMAPLITMPILAADSVALAMAGDANNILFSIGPIAVNMGHIGLAAITAMGSLLVLRPQLLDPTLRLSKWAAPIAGKIKATMRRLVRKTPSTDGKAE